MCQRYTELKLVWSSFETQCVIACGLKERVRRPRSSKLVHRIDASSPQATTQIRVPLMLCRNESHRSSPVHGGYMTHSVSSPMLQGAWSMRNLEHAVPPLDTSRHAGMTSTCDDVMLVSLNK